MIKDITYDEYDHITDVCERMMQSGGESATNKKNTFAGDIWFPTVEELEQIDLDERVDEFYKYLLYYYQSDFHIVDSAMKEEYENMKKYVKKFIDTHTEFVDPPDESEE